ncbi:MAG: outer membrane PBP1 activator LpoA protein [Gammaproteobacteria bacterium]|jgi:outer membrane PBP1 activator LpoA protein
MKLPCLKLLLSAILIVTISACQTPSQPSSQATDLSSSPDSPLTPTEEEILAAFELESKKYWLDAELAYQALAIKSGQPEKSSFLIKSALMLYEAGNYFDIPAFFDSLQESDILEQDLLYKTTLLAGSYFGEGNIYQGLLALPPIEEIIDWRYKALALNIRSKGLLAIGKPKESAELRIQISDYLKTQAEIEQNHNFIWDALNRIPESTITKELTKPQTKQVRGWLELNLIARRSNMLPEKIKPWINNWYERYTEHAAGKLFAFNLLEESKRINIRPERIALMLPFSGRFEQVSEAIQNGFLYAFYQDKLAQGQSPQDLAPKAGLEVINASTDASEFNIQYRQAIENGADFVVGPINKELIELLQSRDSLPVPTLALNYGDESKPSDLNLYQFGLSPEDEAEQIADYALAQGRRHAIILVPDTAWGQRLHQAFKSRFESLGGYVVDSETYPSRRTDYSLSIKKLLNLTTSNLRRTMIQQVIGQSVKFNPRRRQDVDMIFIAANSRQARLIKPQLKFHHAQDLPVYATSHISSSNANADDDRDLNDILFVDIPWMLDNKNNQDHQNISKLWPDSSKRFSRLFAFGIDAYRLIPSLRRLMINPQGSMLQHTGALSVDSNGRVKRSLLMATYENGKAKLLKAPAQLQLPDQLVGQE